MAQLLAFKRVNRQLRSAYWMRDIDVNALER